MKNFLSIDNALDGLARGAAMFGGKTARAIVNAARRKWNGIAPEEQEPYGKGMGGANTEQDRREDVLPPGSPKEAPLKNAEPLRQQRKLAAMERALLYAAELEEQELLKEEIASLKAELGSLPKGGDADGRMEKSSTAGGGPAITVKNEDSANLGFQSAEKTTTAHRSDELRMASKCPACGHESEKAWNGKCESCLVANAEDVGGAKAMVNEKEETCQECGVDLTKHDHKKDCALNEHSNSEKEFRFEDKTGAEQIVNAKDEPEAWERLANSFGVDVKEAKEAASLKNGDSHFEYAKAHKPARPCTTQDMTFGDKCMNCGYGYEKRNSGDTDEIDRLQKQILEEMGKDKAGDKGAFGRVKELQAKVKQLMDKVYSYKKLSNAGDLGPEPWEVASAEERLQWLERAGQDINYATRQWTDLSLDVKRALQDAKDMPASLNNADASGDLDKRIHSDEAGDLAEIARHAEGIEHEVGELANSDKCPQCGHSSEQHQAKTGCYNRECDCPRGPKFGISNADDIQCPYCSGKNIGLHVGRDSGLATCKDCKKSFKVPKQNADISKSEIGEEIGHHIKEKGMPPKQAIAAAFSEAGASRKNGMDRGSEKYGSKDKK